MNYQEYFLYMFPMCTLFVREASKKCFIKCNNVLEEFSPL